jgi:hypothetical protein
MIAGKPISFTDLYYVDPKVFDEMEKLLVNDPPEDLKFVCDTAPLRKGGQDVCLLFLF